MKNTHPCQILHQYRYAITKPISRLLGVWVSARLQQPVRGPRPSSPHLNIFQKNFVTNLDKASSRRPVAGLFYLKRFSFHNSFLFVAGFLSFLAYSLGSSGWVRFCQRLAAGLVCCFSKPFSYFWFTYLCSFLFHTSF